jgi:hypothetical protein
VKRVSRMMRMRMRIGMKERKGREDEMTGYKSEYEEEKKKKRRENGLCAMM